ncbi:MAG: 2-hydroxyacyl-CoA dehydratase subunit D [Candidatus Helarchaeota archaeon]
MEPFTQAAALPNSWVNNWKAAGKKVLGYFCSYIPDEIIYAANILPIRIRARNCTDTPMGDAYMASTACSFTKCCLEAANRKEFEYLDGIVSYNSCDQIRRLFDNIKYKAPFDYQYFLSIPTIVNEVTIEWLSHELSKFKENIEINFHAQISNEQLWRAIKIYNESRNLLKELYELRQRDNPPLRGAEVMQVFSAGVTIPRVQFNDLLTKLLNEAKKKKGYTDYKARVMLVGSLLDDPEYIKIIEDLGGLVVTDSLCYGSRYFWDLVDENEPNPLDALAKRYLSKTSCPRMSDGHPARFAFIKKMIKEFYVDGVIFERMKFCPYWWGEIFLLRDEFKELGVPCLDLEREYTLGGIGQMKTRIQAFLEVLD